MTAKLISFEDELARRNGDRVRPLRRRRPLVIPINIPESSVPEVESPLATVGEIAGVVLAILGAATLSTGTIALIVLAVKAMSA